MLFSINNLVKQRKREKGYRLLIKNLHIRRKAKIALIGASGCGKSTTLDILGLSLAPDSAKEFLFAPESGSIDIQRLWQNNGQDRLASLRLASMGYVLQSGELLPFLTVGENICLAARLGVMPDNEVRDTAVALAEQLGISRLWRSLPATLSVGERQRAAIARALAAKPQVILADEPTAALDPLHAQKVMDIFLKCVDESASALILVTHNAAWARSGGFRILSFALREDENGVTAILDDQNPEEPPDAALAADCHCIPDGAA